uniref:DDE Tnp4 domain-containing protein n=1 Tax=Chenopodium quinoa TaxID=63459 RepID=A0A803N2W9_CHEQI
MRKDWRHWKALKSKETGLGWNPQSGRIDATNEWWDQKIKEKSDFKKFRHKGISAKLENKWDSLFGDSCATGDNVYAPSTDPVINIEEQNIEHENYDEEHEENPENGTKNSVLPNPGGALQVTNEGANASTHASKKAQKQPITKNNVVQMKHMDIDDDRKRKFWIAIAYAISLIYTYYCKYIYKEPCMTLNFTGEKWIREVLNGHPIRCVNAFRMEPRLLLRLCNDLSSKYGLKASGNMSIVEKVCILLYALAQGVSNRVLCERFQRSGDTISRVIHEVLYSISSRKVKGLAHDIIRPYDPSFKGVLAKIATDNRYMPFFKDAIGCIDGTHIEACIPEAQQMPYRGRKGIPTFNVLAACDFDMCFTFVSAGWEGSAHDTRVFLHAIENPEMKFPTPSQGKYYLADKGYPDRRGYLVPYPKLSVETQIQMVVATFALHNYIRINSPTDPLFRVLEDYPDFIPSFELPDINHAGSNCDNREGDGTEMKAIRDHIAGSLWKARRRNYLL